MLQKINNFRFFARFTLKSLFFIREHQKFNKLKILNPEKYISIEHRHGNFQVFIAVLTKISVILYQTALLNNGRTPKSRFELINSKLFTGNQFIKEIA